MNRFLLSIVVLTLFGVPALVSAAAPEPNAGLPAESGVVQIAALIKAYGGREKLAKVHSLYVRGYQKVYQADNDGWVTSYLLRPDKYRIETELHRNSSIRVLAAGSSWMANAADDPLVTADPLTGEWLTFLFNCHDLPLALAEGKWQLVPVEAAQKNAPAKGQLILKNSAGIRLTVTVNSSTNLIDSISGTIGDENNRVVIGMEFQDYREVDGIIVPYRIVSNYAGKPYALFTIAEIHINGEMAGELFAPEAEESGNGPVTE
jgi:hypothetical protein